MTRSCFALRTAITALLLAFCVVASPSWAQVGAGNGALVGQVYDKETGKPIAGAKVVVKGPALASGASPEQVTGKDGTFAFDALPAGSYGVEFSGAGYRESSVADVVVKPGEKNRADFALPPLPKAPAPAATPGAGEAGETAAKAPPVLDIEEFVVVGSAIAMDSLELRINSDELLNVLSAEELSKFAASDVADAAKRVAGVNVVEGQFAIIRGLEDRYSSTLYNGAPVPSPDPDRQSVQLDLFPSDIVSNLIVSKSFAPDSPSNSSGGGIDIATLGYPEEFELKVSAGTGGNPFAFDRFLRFDEGSPIGHETGSWNALESDFSGSIGGPGELLGRSFRYKAVLANEIDFDTAEGTREGHEPKPAFRSGVRGTGDLSLGELSLSSGRFDLTESERSEQRTGYGSFGFDLDTEGNHKIDLSAFYTKKEEETVELRENGYFPGFDYSGLLADQLAGVPFDRQAFDSVATLGAWIARGREEQDASERGPLWYSSFAESRSFATDRDLRIYQINGDHRVAQVEGLSFKWVTNYAKTTQDQSARGLRYFFEPDDLTLVPTTFPVTPDALGTGHYAASSGFSYSDNEIEETQRFGRFDAEYEVPFEVPVLEEVTVKLNAGGWYEKSDRDVAASFLDGNPRAQGQSQLIVTGEDPEDLGDSAFGDLVLDSEGRPQFTRDTTSQATRKIKAWNAGAKATFWDRVDLLGGIRREQIRIASRNDPFTGARTLTGAPGIFPSAYLFLDRLDNPANNEGSAPGNAIYNDEILGIDVPIDPVTGFVDLRDRESIEALVNSVIDETKLLPSLGIAYRPIEGLSLRAAYSKTVARPSFRELGYYATVEPGSDDITVGNPQLQLSDVESFDFRAEYTWGDLGDLVAVSLFAKTIEKPIESIVIRDALNAEFDDSGLFRTFFNNPNEASLRGIEMEARKNLGDLGPELLENEFLEHFSIGGNFTYIQAEVDRTEAELARASQMFGTAPGVEARVQRYEKSRRLYNQPEWIANADVTFDHPDWGTKATLSVFAISSVLDAAGVASVDRLGAARSFVLDRYVDSFYQVDFVASQQIWRGLGAKFSVKNLTNSTREIIYDREQTRDSISERTLKIGRDFSFALTYTLTF